MQGAGPVGEIGLLPPTLSAQYHFNPNRHVRPYIGAGLNYTVFSKERTYGAWQGMKLELDSSFGPAAQLGIDIDVIPGWFINLDARWFDIDTNAKLGGTNVGAIEIDPYAFGVTSVTASSDRSARSPEFARPGKRIRETLSGLMAPLACGFRKATTLQSWAS